jgi:undecaprenyl pyrophosphate phosphatase UppP
LQQQFLKVVSNGAFMQPELLGLYAGPDQVMTVTSALASVIGVLLVFWNKVVAAFFKIFRRSARPAASPSPQQDTPKNSP